MSKILVVMGGRGASSVAAEIASLVGSPPNLSTAFRARNVADGSYADLLRFVAAAVRGAEASHAAACQAPAFQAA